jgi:hypothetical protein
MNPMSNRAALAAAASACLLFAAAPACAAEPTRTLSPQVESSSAPGPHAWGTHAAAAAGLDHKGPNLVGFNAGTEVDAGSATGRLHIDWSVTDNQSGFMFGWMWLRSPSGQVKGYSFGESIPSRKESGTGGVSFGPWSEPGTWTVTGMSIEDANGNQTNVDTAALAALGNTQFTVINAAGADLALPTLRSGKIATPIVSLSQTVPGTAGVSLPAIVNLRLQDTGSPGVSGVAAAWATFCRTDVQSCFTLFGKGDELGAAQRSLRLSEVPARLVLSPAVYTLSSVQVSDFAGNFSVYTSTAFGGTTDFAALFGGSTTITLAP